MSTPIADFLATLDSHTIYDMEEIVKGLKEAGYDGPIPAGYTYAQIYGQIVARGLGGYIAPNKNDDIRMMGGYQVSDYIAGRFGINSQMFGRGSRHRDNIRQIRELGK